MVVRCRIIERRITRSSRTVVDGTAQFRIVGLNPAVGDGDRASQTGQAATLRCRVIVDDGTRSRSRPLLWCSMPPPLLSLASANRQPRQVRDTADVSDNTAALHRIDRQDRCTGPMTRISPLVPPICSEAPASSIVPYKSGEKESRLPTCLSPHPQRPRRDSRP